MAMAIHTIKSGNLKKVHVRRSHRFFFTISAVLLIFFSLTGCKQNKDPSKMSDEEKVAYQLDDSLTAEEKEQQIEARQKILNRMNQTKAGDQALDNAMKNARDLLSDAQYQALETAQNQWLKQGRGQDIQRLTKNGIAAADAFAQAATERADWISQHTSWAMLLDMPGYFGGLYHSSDGRTLELYEMPENHLNMVISVQNQPIYFTATGTYQDQTAQMHAEGDDTILLKINRIEDGSLILVTTEAFSQTTFAKAMPLTEGAFNRYQPGEINVFAP